MPIEYMLTGSLGVLDVAAKYRERFLYGIYQVGARQIAKGSTEAPVAYVIPAAQHDVPAAMAFLETLMKGGIEVHRATRRFHADGRQYPAGTLRRAARATLPAVREGSARAAGVSGYAGAPGRTAVPPYDTAGWTLS